MKAQVPSSSKPGGQTEQTFNKSEKQRDIRASNIAAAKGSSCL